MARKRGRVGCQTLRSVTETPAAPGQDAVPAKAVRSRGGNSGKFKLQAQRMEEDTNVTPTQSFQSQSRPTEGVAVVGEAVRRVPPERAEILIGLSVTSATVAEALRDHAAKYQQLAAAVGSIGIQASDLQTASMNVYNLYSPGVPALPSLSTYATMQQIGSTSLNAFG